MTGARGLKNTEPGSAVVRLGRALSTLGAHGEPCKRGLLQPRGPGCKKVRLKGAAGRRSRAAARVGPGGPDRRDVPATPDSPVDRQGPWGSCEKAQKAAKLCRLKTHSSPRGAGGQADGALGKESRGGCLSVGARVRMESRVRGAAGFWPGTPVGAQGSPGPPGEPGKRDVFAVHFEDFRWVIFGGLEAGPRRPAPRPLRGFHGFGRRAGFPGRPPGPAWRAGFPGRLPGAARRAGQNVFFCCPHLGDFTLVPRSSRKKLALASPSPS